MAFGITRDELAQWKQEVENGHIAFLTHYWLDPRFPGCNTVTKVGCSDLPALIAWCEKHRLPARYIHMRGRHPHFDLFGAKQKEVLLNEGRHDHIRRFGL